MAIKTGKEYRQRVLKRKPKVYLGGNRLNSLMENPTTRSVIEANVQVYELAQRPEFQDVMTAKSHLSEDIINRNLHIHQCIDDLDKRAAMALLTAQKLGTCNYRCPGCDMLSAMASIAWEVDKKKKTEYYQRLMTYLEFLQKNDLVLSGATTDTKGDRSKRPSEQDPDMYVHIVDKKSDGIVVRGAKQHQSGAYAADETMVLTGLACHKGEEDYAIAFATPTGSPGMSYICQYNPYTAERENTDDLSYLGNPIYGQRETCLIIFDDVFVPWERVFLCGEIEYTQQLIARFAKMHRMNCGGACKVGFIDLIIGATALTAEYAGISKMPHVMDKITSMVNIRETVSACSLAAAFKGREEPQGSGVWLPDDAYSNAAKLNVSTGFWQVMALAADIAGGLVATMPHERELENPEIKQYAKKYLKAASSAEKRLRIAKFLQHWVAGLHGASTWHGSGSTQAQMITLYRITDFEEKKRLAKDLAGIKD